ncbi:nicotinate phosphoribosyltransferase [Schizosaccharomyces japonicus yFS275]|uniref:Nicotinate phosphoribosyltransferase n=1 Tax=Schizosaccharomyces japonicus (strain yFS275 / FY16936) TaxID=402676 RepID=B6K3V6_SCHJY|nr:nicotinate phosphoribosyltransferase [Schizosaccharomyces japonicus yFS275]EEB08163.1 nicotinate phosphoribosyltransferase [Schizosaccharomyces japonicus yFS275]
MAVLKSILDTDLYKFTMLQAVMEHYPNTPVSYQFKNRSPAMALNEEAIDWLKKEIDSLKTLSLQDDEEKWMRETCPYLSDEFFTFLRGYRFCPSEQVVLTYDETNKDLGIAINGMWHETILYEIPILALVSEAYFKFVDKDWDYEGQLDKAFDKGKRLIENGCVFSEFGTRRRRDVHTQDLVMQGLVKARQEVNGAGAFSGTSNVYFARKYNVKPIGTVAHEWYMGTAAITNNYTAANYVASVKWRQTFGKNLGIALTDTFSTDAFLRSFTANSPDDLANVYDGVRQDSGSPEEFIKKVVRHYKAIGVNPGTKQIVHSDSLNVDRCIHLQKLCNEAGIGCSFGIGTNFTSDFTRKSDRTQKSKPMNIVVKLYSAGGRKAVKISDDIMKNTGDKLAVEQAKRELKLPIAAN